MFKVVLAILASSQLAVVIAVEPTTKEFVAASVGMKLIRIEPGEFNMGEGAAPPKTREEFLLRDYDESPSHRVTLSKAFYLGEHEVTNKQFDQFDPGNKKRRAADPLGKADTEPVVNVTWQQAVDFCAWLTKQEGQPCRLPTEAEWEYACRAGNTTDFSTGETLTPQQANFGMNKAGTATHKVEPVGSYPANPWGLYDMHGNVAEWCADWHGPYEPLDQTDPVGRASGYARVTRGWSYLKLSDKTPATRFCRSSNRSGHLPQDANRVTGFRVALGKAPSSKLLPYVPALHEQEVKQTTPPANTLDMTKPHFVDYTVERRNPALPGDSWGPVFSQHNHYAACCVCPNGDVLAAWYITVSESDREMAQAASRLRAGRDKFEPASVFFDVPDVNDHAPVLYCDGRRVFHFFTQSLRGWDNASDCVRWSDDSGATWTAPRIMLSRDDPHALSQPCQATRTKAGSLIVACDGDAHKDERILVSRDDGETWQVGRGDLRATVGAYAIHPTICQRDDGSLISFLRGPHPMLAVTSDDNGATWTKLSTKFSGISVGQKATSLKLASGGLLLVSIDTRKELLGGGTFAALSLDDGKSWAHVCKLPGVYGYMAAAQGPDGRIFVIGSKMSCVAFNEAWLRGGESLDQLLKKP